MNLKTGKQAAHVSVTLLWIEINLRGEIACLERQLSNVQRAGLANRYCAKPYIQNKQRVLVSPPRLRQATKHIHISYHFDSLELGKDWLWSFSASHMYHEYSVHYYNQAPLSYVLVVALLNNKPHQGQAGVDDPMFFPTLVPPLIKYWSWIMIDPGWIWFDPGWIWYTDSIMSHSAWSKRLRSPIGCLYPGTIDSLLVGALWFVGLMFWPVFI